MERHGRAQRESTLDEGQMTEPVSNATFVFWC
jgi:hypothetical protein